MKYFLILFGFLILIGLTGITSASQYSGETPLYFFDYLKDESIAYIVNYTIDGYLRNAVVDFDSNTIIFEIKDSGVLTVEIPKTHFLPNDYFPTLLIDKVDSDPREFLTKDEECFREYEFSVNQNTMIELIMERSSDASSIMNENILVNCQNKIDHEITNTFDFNTIFEDGLEYTIIDGKQYLSKTIKSSLANLTYDETIFELSEMKFHLYDDRGPRPVYPGMGMTGFPTPVLFEFPDGVTQEMSIKTTTPHQNIIDKQYTTMDTFSRPNWPEVGIIAGLTPSNQITKLLVFEKNISPYIQLQLGIESNDISCKLGLELIQKYDGSPACVTPETKTKLIERGWINPIEYYDKNCGQFYTAPERQYNQDIMPVLLMNSNPTGCVRLLFTVNDYSHYQSSSKIANFTSSLFIGNNDFQTDGLTFSVSQGKDHTNSFQITVEPKIVDLTNSQIGSTFTVTYVIKSLPNATGFYDHSILMLPCYKYPLAVGYSADQVHFSDFSYIDQSIHPCVSGPYVLTEVEISGFEYKYITLP